MRQRLTAVHLDADSYEEKLEITVTDSAELSLRGDITLDRDGVDELVEDLLALRTVMK